jgi:hypothetical protein
MADYRVYIVGSDGTSSSRLNWRAPTVLRPRCGQLSSLTCLTRCPEANHAGPQAAQAQKQLLHLMMVLAVLPMVPGRAAIHCAAGGNGRDRR